MIKEHRDEDEVIQMLLDTDHFFGEHEGRLAPKIIFILVALLPAVVYVYFGIFLYIPIPFFVIFLILWTIRWALKIPGQESTRLYFYRKQIHDEYASTYSLLRIKHIHDDGLVEYLNGVVSYFVIAYNGDSYDNIVHSSLCEKFMLSAFEDRDYNMYVKNIIFAETLASRYKDVKIFGDMDAARDFLDIIDFNSKIVSENSVMQRIIFQVRGHKSDWKEMRTSIDSAIHSESAKAFKSVHRVTSREEIDEILSMDLDGYIELDSMMRNKYCTGEYYGSRVLCYDDNVNNNKTQTKEVNVKNKSNKGFHTSYTRR